MRNSWRNYFRRLAVACAAVGSAVWTSAVCYAVQLAFDTADDPVYADGWQGITNDVNGNQLTAGDNGGFGFTAWNFDSGYVAVEPREADADTQSDLVVAIPAERHDQGSC